jgi:hypothetical protein
MQSASNNPAVAPPTTPPPHEQSPATPNAVQNASETIIAFMELNSGQFSSLAWRDLNTTLSKNPNATLSVISAMKQKDSLNQRLLGLYLELEHFGFSENLAKYTQEQDSILFATTTSQWLYINQDFRNYSEFSREWINAMSAKQQTELFSYLADIDGERTLPASFGIIELGSIDKTDQQQILRKSPALQSALRTHLLTNNLPTISRNTGLTLLKECQSLELASTIEYFLRQFPEDSRTTMYLIHLRDSADEFEASALQAHIEQVKSSSLNDPQATQSAGVILDAIQAKPELKIDKDALDQVEDYLRKHTARTRNLQRKLAHIEYNRWLNHSQ